MQNNEGSVLYSETKSEMKCEVITGLSYKTIWTLWRETLILLHAKDKGADQTVHKPRLISTFVISFLESLIYKLATCKISNKIKRLKNDNIDHFSIISL